MKTFKAHTKYTKLTKSTRCACAASGMMIFFETEEHKNRLYLCTYVTFVLMSKKSRYALAASGVISCEQSNATSSWIL